MASTNCPDSSTCSKFLSTFSGIYNQHSREFSEFNDEFPFKKRSQEGSAIREPQEQASKNLIPKNTIVAKNTRRNSGPKKRSREQSTNYSTQHNGVVKNNFLLLNLNKYIFISEFLAVVGTWSSGMILASGARGREFDSPSAPRKSERTLCTVFTLPFFFSFFLRSLLNR